MRKVFYDWCQTVRNPDVLASMGESPYCWENICHD